MSEINGTPTAEERLEKVEKELTVATAQRQQTLDSIKNAQKELDQLVKQRMRRPREKISELDERLKKLEHDRTIVSIPLKQEKEILWQMSRVEKLKRQVEDFEEYDTKVKAKKAEVNALRDQLKTLGEQVSELRLEFSMAQKAINLGCSVEELLGMQVECPPDKLGLLIGKKGQNVKQLQEQGNVSIDVAPKEGSVRIIGSLQSLDTTAMNIDRVLAVQEEFMDLPKPLLLYLTSRGITSLGDIRSRHPDVHVEVNRATRQARFRGLPDDIESAKTDVLSVDIVDQKLTVTPSESSIIIGKQGATINKLVESSQAAIDVPRPDGDSDVKGNLTVVIIGSIGAVKDAMDEMEDLLAQHKEVIEKVPLDPVAKEVLLMNKGEGMQAITKLVNDACREILAGYVSVSIDENAVKIVGKSLVMPKAVEIVTDEIRLKEATIVRLPIHVSAIPALIGKGGAGIKRMKEGSTNVVIDADREAGEIKVCSLDPAETEKVVATLNTFLLEQQIKTVKVQPETFVGQFRTLLRSPLWKELNELVTLSRDDAQCEIVLRGNAENLEKAGVMVDSFLQDNHQDNIPITKNDVGALLRGGKESKIEEISLEHDVRLNCDSENCTVEVTGKKEAVGEAMKSIDRFLNGGDGVKVLRMMVDDASAGLLVGRGGGNKAALEESYPNVSISIPPNQTVVLRGPDEDVDACEKHIVKLLVTSFVTEKLVLDDDMQKASKAAALKGYLKSIPVVATFEDTRILVRGTRPDVHAALSVLKSKLGGSNQSRVFLEASQFHRLQSVSRDSHFARIEEATETKIGTDPRTSSVTISGKKETFGEAKTQLIQLLGFLLSDNFACESVSSHTIHLLGHPNQLGAIAEESGAFLYIDRDAGAVVISSSSAERVGKAKDLFTGKVAALDSMYYELDVGVDAEWIIPKLIGKGGSRIKTLRKSFDCTLEMGDQTMTIISDDPEKLAKAKEELDEIVANERAECFYVEISDNEMAAFMGLKGVHVTEFEKTHNVRAQALRKKTNSLRITGEVEPVAKAKAAFEEWLEDFRKGNGPEQVELYEFEPSEMIMLTRLIGKGGKRIKELRKKCGCKIEIDVDNRYMKLVASDADILASAKKIIEEVLEHERGQNVVVHLSKRDLSAFIGAKGAHIREFEQTHGVRATAMKDDSGDLQLSGDSEAVFKAKLALDFWVTVRGTPTVEDGPEEDRNDMPSFSNRNRNFDRESSRAPRKAAAVYQPPPEEADFPALDPEKVVALAIETGVDSRSWAGALAEPPNGQPAPELLVPDALVSSKSNTSEVEEASPQAVEAADEELVLQGGFGAL